MGTDYELENLLLLDGEIIEADLELEFFAHFQASEVAATEGRPYGIKYSLTLHDKNNERILGFDNAHKIEDKSKGKFSEHRKVSKWDHRHKLNDVTVVIPYDFVTPTQLIIDFWKAVDEAITLEKQRGL